MSETTLSLDAIGRQTGTDKASSGHNYLAFYERFFGALRLEPIKILEVGVLQGASLKVWERYFPNATIIGADIEPSTARFKNARIKMKILDQSNIQNLVDLGVEHGPFDIIIEDGSHLWEHQITTLKTLFPFLKNHGYYVVEDLQTNYGPMAADYQGHATISCMEYLKQLVDLRVSHGQTDIAKVEDPFLRTYGRSVGFMVFTQHACLLEKSLDPPAKPPTFASLPLVATEGGLPPTPYRLMAHVGHFGDYTDNGSGSISVDDSGRSFVQGFMISGPAALENLVRYRARLAYGTWTAWAHANIFVGTRAVQTDLTGLSVELVGDLRAKYDLIVAAAFSGSNDIVVAGSGEDCVSTPQSFLRGIQLMFRPRSTTPGASLPADPQSSRSLSVAGLKDLAR
ncbi:hypothetical protein [Acidisoma cladoniae]|uniref:hypothetical protein n=1 Tax=Acidisoma cladoniae TaxID=3040935 RepID=UPI00254EB865|nr:hypothetical protein [Acidisoma sp. PAMC 29798]